jgi:hypothetical protein
MTTMKQAPRRFGVKEEDDQPVICGDSPMTTFIIVALSALVLALAPVESVRAQEH